MAVTSWIIDTSALHKLGSSPELDLWLGRIERGLVFVAAVTLLEVGYSTRSSTDYRQVFDSGLIRNLIELPSTRESDKAAIGIQQQLVAKGHHRGVAIPDLLVAALGLTAGHTVLHSDKDFEIISSITNQETERLAE
jgi:predicted nucleic acid-binding protein